MAECSKARSSTKVFSALEPRVSEVSCSLGVFQGNKRLSPGAATPGTPWYRPGSRLAALLVTGIMILVRGPGFLFWTPCEPPGSPVVLLRVFPFPQRSREKSIDICCREGWGIRAKVTIKNKTITWKRESYLYYLRWKFLLPLGIVWGDR